LDHLLSIGWGGKEVASRSEVLGNGPIGGEEALGVTGGFKPLHAALPLARGLMGILRAVVQIAMLTVLHPRPNLLVGPENSSPRETGR
jgi:hypothetical protein